MTMTTTTTATTAARERMENMGGSWMAPALIGTVEPCGCIVTPEHFYPCEACKAEVHADLAEVYSDAADWRLK
jgi:hypothetical protein